MSFSRRLARWLIGLVASLISVAAFGGLATWFFLQSSLPPTEGRIALAGPREPITIDRDADGIPHIRARSAADAYFALGYVHAQDRLWQMEAMRRFGAGRLSEVLGRQTLPLDRLMRTLGTYRLAERIYPALAPEVRSALDAYATGVNAFIANHQGAWPAEFYVLGLRPEPWKPADSLVWGQLMTLRLSGDWRGELARQRLAARLRSEQIEQLLDKPSAGGPVTVDMQSRAEAPARGPRPDYAAQPLPLEPHAAAEPPARLPDWLGPTSASNSWVLAGDKTASGKPLLANDPHLGLELPSIWYLARIDAPGLSLSGATAPGVPFHVLGHNSRIAWGLTTTGSDVQDLFVERTDPSDAMRYLTPDGSAPFALRKEIIKVRGGADETLNVRETRHGVVVSDLMSESLQGMPAGDVLALSAAGLRADDRTPEALYRLNRARDWTSFTAALRFFHSPQQNIAYADVDGNIGFYVAGRVPLRKRGEGLYPVPGWTGDYDWTGFIPFEELPHLYNPARGQIANANNRVVGPDYPYPLGHEWPEDYRIRRIERMLAAKPVHDAAEMARMQADVRSLAASELLPLMLPALQGAPDIAGRYAGLLQKLVAWNGDMTMDRPEPLVFDAWLRELTPLLIADELGPLFPSYWRMQPAFVADVLREDRQWCDDVSTPEAESCDSRIRSAFLSAAGKLAAAYGPDPAAWRWGDAHVAPLANRVMSRVPLLSSLADAAIPTPGDDSTVNRGTTTVRDERAPFAHVHGPSLRAIYDFADLDQSRFMIAGGQSGNVISRHYADLIRRWRDVGYVTLPHQPAAAARLMLVPAYK